MICFDLSAAAQERAGLGRYAANLAQALLKLGVPLHAFVNDLRTSHLQSPLRELPMHTAQLPRKAWRLRAAAGYWGGPHQDATFPGITLFHATEHLLPRLTQARAVFTLHDVAYLLYPQYHLLQNRLYLQLMLPRFLARAAAVICVSESTRRDAERFYHLPAEKLHVIPEGVEAHFAPITNPAPLAAVRAKYQLPPQFLLCVGTLEPRKNLLLLLEAYAAVRQQHPTLGLVLAGGKGWLYAPIFERVRQLGLEDCVTFTGYVPEADLPALLNAALLFVYPSLFEGFGLPPLEAMACGTPVVCAQTSSLPEVVGQAGVLLPSTQPAAWVEALTRLCADAAWRRQLSIAGLARAQQFTWEAAARQTLAVYQTVLSLAQSNGS